MNQARGKRKSGKERRKQVLNLLQQTPEPVTGSELADRMQVSRQVIVQDISLLRAKEYPIVATSQGYLYLRQAKPEIKTRIIACRHTLKQTEHELNLIVDCGVTVVDVTVEHPVYGEITGSLMIKNRMDVKRFMEKLSQTGASLLSSLTDGVHLHKLESVSADRLNAAEQALKKSGYLLL
ncbi:transcription repressor NadR [Sporolactobacillus sp. THM7-4]|nr:transcription repressor NadR [Sporolactobacillus sp. THM7-4]